MNTDQFFNTYTIILALLLPFILICAAYLAWKLWQRVKKEKAPEIEIVAEAPAQDPAKETMDRLTKLLSKIEPNSAAAEAKLLDARTATEVLTRQVLKVVERVEHLERQADCINQTVVAIRTGQRADIAYLAGKLGDDSLRQILLSPYLVSRPDFQTEAFGLLANERGSLEECAAGYSRLVTALVVQLARARTRILSLEQSVQMLEASHPLLQIEQGLQQSVEALNLRTEPALRWTAKQALPAGVQGYLVA